MRNTDPLAGNRGARLAVAAAAALAAGALFAASVTAQPAGRRGPQRGDAPPSGSASPARAPQQGAPAPSAIPPLPPDKTTSHKLRIGDSEIPFDATAGTIPLYDLNSGAVSARIGYIAFVRSDAAAAGRPLTFLWNGGPGYASAWLNLGAIGPWRLDMDAAAARPSAPPVTQDNQESWLEFTDLVFIDPAGTGYGRLSSGDNASKFFWSVEGDIASLATVVRRWSEANNRMSSPKYLAGESYGGFRVPKVALKLQNDEGVGINGQILISPVLDFGLFRSGGVLSHVSRLPTYAATARAKSGAVTRDSLADVEAYAQGDFLLDLMKGLKDDAALSRLAGKVSQLTSLEPQIVRRFASRIPPGVFAREFHRAEGRIASSYDGLVTGLDPAPFSRTPAAEDQMRIGLHAPIVQTMVEIYHKRLEWIVPAGRYRFQNASAGRQWDWGRRNPDATGDLAKSMALDPSMQVLVTHGLTDLVTPYFQTKLVLDQMPAIGDPARLRFQVYPGGHMFYSLTASRIAFRDDARRMMTGK